MLRWIFVLLLLANAAYYAWSHGQLATWGLAPTPSNEPERVRQQLRAHEVRLLTDAAPPAPTPAPADPAAPDSAPAAASPASAPAPALAAALASASSPASAPVALATAPASAPAPPDEPTQCLQVGGLNERQADALRQAAAALPADSWTLEATTVPERWMVYMGRFADAEAVEKKRAELRALGVSYDRPGAAWEHGLSLGRFSSEERAQAALKDLARQGIRTARVVQERTESQVYTLRLPAVNRALRSQLPTLRRALAGKRLQPCE